MHTKRLPHPAPNAQPRGRRPHSLLLSLRSKNNMVTIILATHSLAHRCRISHNLFGNRTAIQTLGNISFRLRTNGALTIINRSNYNGSALTHTLALVRRPSSNSLGVTKRRIAKTGGTRHGRLHGSIRVIFRDPCTSLGPQRGVNSRLTRPLLVGASLSTTRHHRGIRTVVGRINLQPRRCRHCPRVFSNNRHRHVTLTQTVVLRPGILITSRPASTLSISVRTRILGLFVSLRRRFGATCIFVSRGLTIIHRITSRIVIVCLNQPIRVNPGRSVCAHPLRPCARTLLSTAPAVRPSPSGPGVGVINRLPGPLGPPSNYTFRGHYPCTARHYDDRRPTLHILSGQRITYRCTRSVGS